MGQDIPGFLSGWLVKARCAPGRPAAEGRPCCCAQAREYLNKLPASLDAEDRVLITDPMLATGARARQVGWQLSAARCMSRHGIMGVKARERWKL